VPVINFRASHTTEDKCQTTDLDLLMALQRKRLSISMRYQLLSHSGFLQGDLNDYGGIRGTIRSEGSGNR
jgi:hypothetical protein